MTNNIIESSNTAIYVKKKMYVAITMFDIKKKDIFYNLILIGLQNPRMST